MGRPDKPFAVITNSGNVVRRDILDGYAIKSSREIPEDTYSTAQYGIASLVEPYYNPESLTQLLEQNTFHARCVNTKASDMVGVGWGLTPLVDNPSEEQKLKVEAFFKDNVKAVTFDDLNLALAIDYWAGGMAYEEVVRIDNEPLAEIELINHLPAYTMRVHKSNNKFAQQRGTLIVWFKRFGYEMDVHYKTGQETPLGSLYKEDRASEIITFKIFNSRSDYYGLAPVIPAIGAISGMQGLQNYNLNFFDTYGVPAYAVYVTGDYELGELIDSAGVAASEEGYDSTTGEYAIVRLIKEHLEAIKNNPQSPLILAIPSAPAGPAGVPGKVEIRFERLAAEVKEASFRLYRADTKDEILVANGVPPYRVGLTEMGALGSNVATETTEIYKSSVVKPGQRVFATPINELILREGLGITDWEFFFEEIDTSDEKHDMEVAQFLFTNGAMTPNQLIQYFGKRFGVDTIDDPLGNSHFIPSGAEALETRQAGNEAMLSSVKEMLDRMFNIMIKDRARNG